MKQVSGRVEAKTDLLSLRSVLDVQLVQRLDMIARESDGDHDDVVLTDSVKTLDGVDCLRTLPGGRTDLGLPGESVAEERETRRDLVQRAFRFLLILRLNDDSRVSVPELLHDGKDGSGDFSDVGISSAGEKGRGREVRETRRETREKGS